MATTSERMAFIATMDVAPATTALHELAGTAVVEGGKVEAVIKKISTLPPPKMPLPAPTPGTAVALTKQPTWVTGFGSKVKQEAEVASTALTKLGGTTGQVGKAFDSLKSTVKNNSFMIEAAIAAGVAKSIIDFEKLALEVEKVSTTTKLSAEASSRWIDVAQDYGVGVDKLEVSLSRLAKTIGTTPEKLSAFGFSAVKGKDGLVDMNATMLAAIDTYNKIPDAAKKAAFATTAFGRGWTDLAPILNRSSSQIEDALRKVSSSKVVNQKDIEDARQLSLDIAELKDQVEGLELAIGKFTAPKLVELVHIIQNITHGFSDLDKATHGWLGRATEIIKWTHPIKFLEFNVNLASAAYDKLTGASDNTSTSLKEQASLAESDARTLQHVGSSADDLADSFDAAQGTIADVVNAMVHLTDEAKAAKDAVKDLTSAEEDAFNKNLDVGDRADAVANAFKKQADALKAVQKAQKEKGKSAASDQADAQRAYEAAVRDSIRAIDDLAKTQAEAKAASEGQADNQAYIDKLWAGNLHNLAAYLNGPMKKSIEDHAKELEKIPGEAVTKVKLDAGELDSSVSSVRAKLQNLEDVPVVITVDADTSKFYSKLAGINAAAEAPKKVTVTPSQALPTTTKPGVAGAAGGDIPAGYYGVVGERGTEILKPKAATRTVVPNGTSPTKAPDTVTNYYVTFHVTASDEDPSLFARRVDKELSRLVKARS